MKQVDVCYEEYVYEPRTKKWWIPHDEYIKERENRYKKTSDGFYKQRTLRERCMSTGK